MRYKLFLTAAAILFTGTAAAYVGPGAGISVLGALWGLIIGVVMAVGIILFWPIRMMIRKAKANKAASSNSADAENSEAQDSNAEHAESASASSPSASQQP